MFYLTPNLQLLSILFGRKHEIIVYQIFLISSTFLHLNQKLRAKFTAFFKAFAIKRKENVSYPSTLTNHAIFNLKKSHTWQHFQSFTIFKMYMCLQSKNFDCAKESAS